MVKAVLYLVYGGQKLDLSVFILKDRWSSFPFSRFCSCKLVRNSYRSTKAPPFVFPFLGWSSSELSELSLPSFMGAIVGAEVCFK